MHKTLKHLLEALCTWVGCMAGGLNSELNVIMHKASFSLGTFSDVSICKSFLWYFWTSLEKDLQLPAKKYKSDYVYCRNELGGISKSLLKNLCSVCNFSPTPTILGALKSIISPFNFSTEQVACLLQELG